MDGFGDWDFWTLPWTNLYFNIIFSIYQVLWTRLRWYDNGRKSSICGNIFVCYISSRSIAGPAVAPIWRQEVNLWALAHAQSRRAQPRDSSAALLFKPPPQVQVLIPFTVGQQQGRGVCLGSCELASGWPGEWLTGVGQYFKLIKTKPFVSESRPAMVAFVRWSFHWNFSSYLAPCEAWNQL